MPGEFNILYVEARRLLLDTLEVLGEQREAVIIVGAQAVYLHTGESEFAVAEYTTDADIALEPRLLKSNPLIEDAMAKAGLTRDPKDVGIWQRTQNIASLPTPVTVKVDLLVPEALSGRGSRSVEMPPHSKFSARSVKGLEAVIADNLEIVVNSFEKTDTRSFKVKVAGPASLIVAKLFKINDRILTSRSSDKDALDLLRLLRKADMRELIKTFTRLMSDAIAGPVTAEAVNSIESLFGSIDGPGSQMAAAAAAPEDPDMIAGSCTALFRELLTSI